MEIYLELGYTWKVNSQGYSLFYKDVFVSGAGTLQSSFEKKKIHWKTKQKNVDMYYLQLATEIKKHMKENNISIKD